MLGLRSGADVRAERGGRGRPVRPVGVGVPEESFHDIEDFIKGGDYEAGTVHAGRVSGSAPVDPEARAAEAADEVDRATRPVELVHAAFGMR